MIEIAAPWPRPGGGSRPSGYTSGVGGTGAIPLSFKFGYMALPRWRQLDRRKRALDC